MRYDIGFKIQILTAVFISSKQRIICNRNNHACAAKSAPSTIFHKNLKCEKHLTSANY